MDESNHTGRFRPNWLIILLGAAVLLILLAVGGWAYFQSKLDKMNFVPPTDGELTASGSPGGKSWISDLESINVLLLGTDERTAGGGTKDFSEGFLEDARADACMLLNVNFKDHTVRLVSLERAIGVPIPGYGDDWLTHAFRFGGAELMMKTVSEQFNIDVRRYARVNVSAASRLIDAIGGVDLVLTETEAAALNGEIYTNASAHTRVKPGLNHLDGFDALAYARQRFIDDDWHRVQRQRNVLQAAIDQTKHLNLLELNHLLDEALPLVETNFTKQEITSLLPKAPAFLGVQFRQMTLPLPGTFGSKLTDDGRSLMMLDRQENIKILYDFLYGEFDPSAYEAPREVRGRVWAAQQKAAAEWSLRHPDGLADASSGAESDEELPGREAEEDEGDRPRRKPDGDGRMLRPRDEEDAPDFAREDIPADEGGRPAA